jgi:hypothetical protein
METRLCLPALKLFKARTSVAKTDQRKDYQDFWVESAAAGSFERLTSTFTFS